MFVYAIVILFLPRSLNILFRNLYFMSLILKTKYTLSIEFVLAQVRSNNHWRTSRVRLEILNDRTLPVEGNRSTRRKPTTFGRALLYDYLFNISIRKPGPSSVQIITVLCIHIMFHFVYYNIVVYSQL